VESVRRASLGPDLVFAIVVATGLISGTAWLNDPGSPWHLRLGRDILASGHVPRADTLTWTRAGMPWVDQSWLFDVALATVVDKGSLSLAVALAVLGVAWVYRSVARWLEADGVSPISATTAAVLAAGVGSVHFLLRPHLVTFGLVAWTLHACRVHHERGGRLLWTIPPLTVVWANCHGGFLAGPVIVGTAMVGHAFSGAMDGERRRRLRNYVLVLGLMGLATFCTPYGLDLHRHVVRLLVTSGVTGLIDEYQPIPFGKPNARLFEWVLIALVALPSLTGRRIGRYDLAHGLAWLHAALASIRNAPLFGLAIAPALGRLFDGALARPEETAGGADRDRPWFALAAGTAVVVAVFSGWEPARMDRGRWPMAGLQALDGQPSGARIFHEQDWGGLVEAEASPRRRAYVDDRFELFGRQGILDYLAVLEGGPAWDEQQQAHRFDLVWVRPNRGLAKRLANDPGWRVVHRDEISVLLAKARGNESARRW
jgi:hypothetical protein